MCLSCPLAEDTFAFNLEVLDRIDLMLNEFTRTGDYANASENASENATRIILDISNSPRSPLVRHISQSLSVENQLRYFAAEERSFTSCDDASLGARAAGAACVEVHWCVGLRRVRLGDDTALGAGTASAACVVVAGNF